MNPQLMRAIAVERMNDIAREAEERRRVGDLPRRARRGSHGKPTLNGHWSGLRASIRRLQRA